MSQPREWSNPIPVKLTAEQMELVQQVSDLLGIAVSTYIRQAVAIKSIQDWYTLVGRGEERADEG